MCVIMTVTGDARPTRDDFRMAREANPHGVGLAWVEDGSVRFEKGTSDKDVARILKLALKVPAPFVLHFRWASVGAVCSELCHPFPLRREKALAVAGATKHGVLFHNGTWSEWRAHTMATACSTGEPLGDGPMSDTRAMAYLATVLGTAVLSTLPTSQKLALVTPSGVRRLGNGWERMADGWHVSNTKWLPATEEPETATEPKGRQPAIVFSGPEKWVAEKRGDKTVLRENRDLYLTKGR